MDIQRQETARHGGENIVVIIGQGGQLQDFAVELVVTVLKGHTVLAQFTRHVVEIVGEDSKLIMRLDGNRVREIPPCHRHCPFGQYPYRCHDTPCQEAPHPHTHCHAYYTQREPPPTCLGDLHLHLMQGQAHAYCAPFLCAAWHEHWHSNIVMLRCSPR